MYNTLIEYLIDGVWSVHASSIRLETCELGAGKRSRQADKRNKAEIDMDPKVKSIKLRHHLAKSE